MLTVEGRRAAACGKVSGCERAIGEYWCLVGEERRNGEFVEVIYAKTPLAQHKKEMARAEAMLADLRTLSFDELIAKYK